MMRKIIALCIIVVMCGGMQAAGSDNHDQDRVKSFRIVLSQSQQYMLKPRKGDNGVPREKWVDRDEDGIYHGLYVEHERRKALELEKKERIASVNPTLLKELENNLVHGSENDLANLIRSNSNLRENRVDNLYPTTWYAFRKRSDDQKSDKRVFNSLIRERILDVNQLSSDGCSLLMLVNTPEDVEYLVRFNPNFALKNDHGNDAIMRRLSEPSLLDLGVARALIRNAPAKFFRDPASLLNKIIYERTRWLKKKGVDLKSPDLVDEEYWALMGDLAAKTSEGQLRKTIIPYAKIKDHELRGVLFGHDKNRELVSVWSSNEWLLEMLSSLQKSSR